MILPRKHRPAQILLAEDNDDDVILTRQAFKHCGVHVELHHVNNGADCMKYLRKHPPFETATTPDLILLDLNMPLLTGPQVMAQITVDEQLQHLPVVVLTTSQHQEEVLKMYRMRVNSYFVKPVHFSEFQEVVKALGAYWFKSAVLTTSQDL